MRKKDWNLHFASFTVAITSWSTVMTNPCHSLQQIYFNRHRSWVFSIHIYYRLCHFPIVTFYRVWHLGCMTGDASIAGDAYPVDAPGLAPSGVHAIQTFLFSWIVIPLDLWLILLTLGYTTIYIYKYPNLLQLPIKYLVS